MDKNKKEEKINKIQLNSSHFIFQLARSLAGFKQVNLFGKQRTSQPQKKEFQEELIT